MKPRKPLTEQGARDSALRALGRREHSAAELQAKLQRRGHDADTASEVVEGLSERGWQSDTRYAEMLLRNRVQQGYGRLRILAELEAARVPRDEISAAMAAADCDWTELACALQRRRFGGPPAGAAEWQKQYRFLAGRGFESGPIRAALKGGAQEPESDPE
ncbi:regulatory protein RecX [Solimonas sp. K1W22B-7]|uniref:regulatory protein RecX n=1 Tax=Solimonas sp. K1W22B-7 TaxID=2303331 RepID=UPI001F09659D|nr:regulatory protein RecX [Solimonas sp. K1W22B-7]